jgi:acetoin:2,6-dichlorophenolindophenol oxidoreductase subunit alpha
VTTLQARSALDAVAAPRLLRGMFQIRQFEEALIELYRRNLVPGFIHPGIGEEAVHVGCGDHLHPTDHVIASHRGHGQALAKGADPGRMMAEALGRRDGLLGGRGGSLHVGDPTVGCLPASPLVGGGLAVATGLALSHARTGDGGVAVCFFGDGALNRGSFHEAVNLAAIWRLPVVYVCIDNGWAISVPRSLSTAGSLVDRARAYGLPGELVDGKDLLSCHAAAGEAVARARAGEGPTVLFFDCPRAYGHEEGDQQAYRDNASVEDAVARDPIPAAIRTFKERGWITDAEVTELEKAVDQEIRDAVAFALASPMPEAEEALRAVRPEQDRVHA